MFNAILVQITLCINIHLYVLIIHLYIIHLYVAEHQYNYVRIYIHYCILYRTFVSGPFTGKGISVIPRV